eukprot:8488536-Pyramimonas_sp.AAC.1
MLLLDSEAQSRTSVRKVGAPTSKRHMLGRVPPSAYALLQWRVVGWPSTPAHIDVNGPESCFLNSCSRQHRYTLTVHTWDG